MSRFDLDAYVTVAQRLTAFWDNHPDGRIETNLMSDPNDWTVCRFKATVYTHRDNETPSASGWAFEIADPGGKGPNATSHEENAETSAIGRALANMDYETTVNRPSREEMAKVNRQSSAAATSRSAAGIKRVIDDPITDNQIRFIHDMLHACHLTEEDGHRAAHAYYPYAQRFDGLTKQDATALIDRLKAKREEIEAARKREVPSQEVDQAIAEVNAVMAGSPGADKWTV